MIRELYENRKNRDARARDLKKQGYAVTRSSTRNQLLHPEYVEDFEGPEKDDTGLGNEVYKTHFAVLYRVEAWI